jgi:hypothetical protein
MLSEAYALAKSLEQSDCELPESHPDVKEPGKFPGYRVALGKNGLPVEIEEIDRGAMASLWTIRQGKQNSFPVVNVQRPLLEAAAESDLRRRLGGLKTAQRKERVELLQEALRVCLVGLNENDDGMWRRVRDRARELLPLFAGKDRQFNSLPELIKRFAEQPVRPQELVECLARRLVEWLATGRLQDPTLAEKLLLGRYDNKSGQFRAEVRIVLDAAGDFQTRVASARMKNHVCRCLATQVRSAATGRCALSGAEQPLLTDRCPDPNLPLLGETKFFSMNPDAPCQRRYGLTGLSAFPLGQATAERLEKAIKFITGKTRQGKTWRTVANGKFEVTAGRKTERADLLIVYVDGEPMIDAQVADCFGVDQREVQKQFETDATAVCRAFEGIVKRRPDSRLSLFLLRKADKEKKQVVLAESPTVKEALDAVHGWQRGARNVPEVVAPLPPQTEGEKVAPTGPPTPFPDQVVRLLSEEWVRGGLDCRKVEGVGLGQVLEVMLRVRGGWQRTALLMLGLTVARLGPLLSGFFGALLTGDSERWQQYPEHARRCALVAVSVLGILLHALGRLRESYMADTAFLLGRLLALADTLHKEYCRHVRRGDVPPQLLGNSLIPVAAANPEDAVARLGQRIGVYKAWADKAEGEPSRLAKWAVGQMGDVCHRLHRPLPTRADRTFQAELFLGYMARSPGKAGSGDGDTNDPASER